VTTQKIENPDFKHKFGMEEKQAGYLVIRIDPDSPARGLLKPDDVIISIEPKRVRGEAKVKFAKGVRKDLFDTIKRSQIGDIVIIRIIRNERFMHVKVKLSKQIQFSELVRPEQYDVQPTYFIFGGLVFEPLTVNYLKRWGEDWQNDAPSNLINYFRYGKRTRNRKEIIVLVQILDDETNIGYYDFGNKAIINVNKRFISSMEDLVRAFEEYKGKYHTIIDERGYKIVLDRKKINRRGKEILDAYGIDSDRSPDLEQTPVTLQGLLLDSIKVIKNSKTTSRTFGRSD
jgi:hypothetical protein